MGIHYHRVSAVLGVDDQQDCKGGYAVKAAQARSEMTDLWIQYMFAEGLEKERVRQRIVHLKQTNRYAHDELLKLAGVSQEMNPYDIHRTA